MRLSHTLAFLPTLGVFLLPKCPLCVAAYLSAAGCGAAVARAVAPGLLTGARVVAVVVAVFVVLRLVRLALPPSART